VSLKKKSLDYIFFCYIIGVIYTIYTIYKKTTTFQLFWTEFFFPKMTSILNTYNTCKNR